MKNHEIKPDDHLIHEGHLTLVQRPYLGKMFDVIISKNAAAIMYIDPEDCVYMVKQYRPALEKEILELPAETMDKPGKSSLEVIVEGLEEECGILINENQVNHFAKVISSSGHDTEYVDLFYASGPCEITKQRLEDTERIEVVRIPFFDAYGMIQTGEIEGSKSTILLQQEYIKRLEQKYGMLK